MSQYLAINRQIFYMMSLEQQLRRVVWVYNNFYVIVYPRPWSHPRSQALDLGLSSEHLAPP